MNNDPGCWILDIGCWMLDVGCWILNIGYWMLDVGCWMLDSIIVLWDYNLFNIANYRWYWLWGFFILIEAPVSSRSNSLALSSGPRLG
jgi:hypothetical protein